MRSPRLLVPAIAFVALGAAACGDAFTAGAAVVNGESISQAELEVRLAQQNVRGPDIDVTQQRRALTALIQEKLLAAEGERRGIEATADEVAQREREIRGSIPAEQLAGFTDDGLRDAIREVVVQEKLARELAEPVTDEQVETVYRAERSRFEQARVRHILFRVENQDQDAPARADAERVMAQLRDGASFARLARRHSDDSTASRGGDLGWISPDEVVQAFSQAAFGARINRPVGPVRSEFGYHLILVTDKRVQPLSAVSEQIRGDLEAQVARGAIEQFLSEAIRDAQIRVNPRFGDWDPDTRQVVPHESFVPASPEPQPNEAPDFLLPQQ